MISKPSRACALLTSLLFALSPAMAQQTTSMAMPDTSSAHPAAKTFSQEELDRLLAPIALYPDALLAQILMASTYPLEVVEAARWAKANPKLNGKALEDAMASRSWDPAVKALTSVPQVLTQMSENLNWMQTLGDAFLAQQADVMDTVQELRARANASGNLKTTEQLIVKTETEGPRTIYIVESPKPEVVYVPTYNPTVVYGTWWYPTPPYYVHPPAYVYPPGLAFATGVLVGAAIWGGCNWGWGRSSVNININRYNSFNRTKISNTSWNHNVNHRRGVAYRDQTVARQYNRGGNISATQARENFRGRAETGRSELKSMDRSQLNNRVQNADRGVSAATRDRVERTGSGEAAANKRIESGQAGNRAQNSDRLSSSTTTRDRVDGGGRPTASNRAESGGRGVAANRAEGGAGAASNRVDNSARAPRSTASDRSGAGGFSGVGNAGSTRQASQRGSASRAEAGSRGGGDRAGVSGGGGNRGGGGGGRIGGRQ